MSPEPVTAVTLTLTPLMRLARGTRGNPGPFQTPDVTRDGGRTSSGTVYDIYRHRRKKRGVWVLVPVIVLWWRAGKGFLVMCVVLSVLPVPWRRYYERSASQ